MGEEDSKNCLNELQVNQRARQVEQHWPSPQQAAKSIQEAGRIFITVSALITLYLGFNTSSKTIKDVRVCVRARAYLCLCADCRCLRV